MARFSVAMAALAVALGTLPLIENSNLLMRPMLAVSILAVLFCTRERMQRAELTWIALLFVYLFVFCLSAMNSVVPDVAAVNVGRQAFISVVSIALVILFRDPDVRLAGLRSTWIIYVVAVSLTFWIYALLMPTYGFSYEGTRLIKGVALSDYGIGLNFLSYLLIIALLCLRTAYPPRFWTDVLLFGTAFVCIVLLGSRAPLIALLIAWLVVSIVGRLWRRSPLIGGFAVAGSALFLGLCVVMVADYAVEIRDLFGAEALREISVGRTDLWEAGFRMWVDRPLLGWGPESWKLVLLEFLPNTNERLFTLLSNLESGSFHNGFVTVAAERGSLGLITAVLIQVYVFYCAVDVFRHRHLLDERDRPMAAVVPTLMLFIFLRSLAESSGLFGNANAAADYMTYFLSSYVVALHVAVCRQREAPPELIEQETDDTAPQALPS